MPVLCNICTGCLDKSPVGLTEEADRKNTAAIALKCGHIFHQLCVEEWFHSGSGKDGSGRSRCPNCLRTCRLSEALPVFPTFGVNDNEITAQIRKVLAIPPSRQPVVSAQPNIRKLLRLPKLPVEIRKPHKCSVCGKRYFTEPPKILHEGKCTGKRMYAWK